MGARKPTAAGRLIQMICFVTLIAGAVLTIALKDTAATLIGLTIGLAVSLVKVYILESSINKALDQEKKQAQLFMGLSNIGRTLLTLFALAVGAIADSVEFWAVVAGVAALPVSAYIAPLVFKNEFLPKDNPAGYVKIEDEEDKEDEDPPIDYNI